MRNLIVVLVFLVLPMFWSVQAQPTSQFSRYTGVLSHSKLAQEQLAKLDFVVAKQSAAEFKLIGILSLYFGGFDSTEYVTYHFNEVTYNVLTGGLVFDQPDQGVSIVVTEFSSGVLKGRLRSNTLGDVGELLLSTKLNVQPTKPLVQMVWGEYQGTCNGVQKVLQIQTTRTSDDSIRMGNPFGTFNLSAQLAEVDPTRSLCETSDFCIKRAYDKGSYDFFSGKLELAGRADKLQCIVDEKGITCNSCKYTRTSKEFTSFTTPQTYPQQGSPDFNVPNTQPTSPAVPDPTQSLGGNYNGYLFHERLGVYQAISLNLVSYQGRGASGNQALFLSGVGSMYFGGFSSNEVINHRFNVKEYPLLSPQIVLERMDGDADAIVQITQLGNGTAKGVWYSILFGRVGTFLLTNTVDQPAPPLNAVVMSSISGDYQGATGVLGVKRKLNLEAIKSSTPVNTVNPFFPLDFKGIHILGDSIVTPTRIDGGSYDFYTGKIGLYLEDQSVFTGFVTSNNQLKLKRPTPGTIRPLSPHLPFSFTK